MNGENKSVSYESNIDDEITKNLIRTRKIEEKIMKMKCIFEEELINEELINKKELLKTIKEWQIENSEITKRSSYSCGYNDALTAFEDLVSDM